MAVRLEDPLAPDMARLGTIKTNAISCQGFSISPGPHLGEGGQLPLHDCAHLKQHNHRAEVW